MLSSKMGSEASRPGDAEKLNKYSGLPGGSWGLQNPDKTTVKQVEKWANRCQESRLVSRKIIA